MCAVFLGFERREARRAPGSAIERHGRRGPARGARSPAGGGAPLLCRAARVDHPCLHLLLPYSGPHAPRAAWNGCARPIEVRGPAGEQQLVAMRQHHDHAGMPPPVKPSRLWRGHRPVVGTGAVAGASLPMLSIGLAGDEAGGAVAAPKHACRHRTPQGARRCRENNESGPRHSSSARAIAAASLALRMSCRQRSSAQLPPQARSVA